MDFGQRETVPMTEETTAQFIARRERELLAQISALRGQLVPKEAELAQIQRMKEAMQPPGSPLSSLGAALLGTRNSNSFVDGLRTFLDQPPPPPPPEQYSQFGLLAALGRTKGVKSYSAMTIKELVIQALLDAFPNGATAAHIREFIRAGYDRTIEPSSLRPQMHRLKADSVLSFDPKTETWNLTPEKRLVYLVDDDPKSSIERQKLLEDEEPDRDGTGEPNSD